MQAQDASINRAVPARAEATLGRGAAQRSPDDRRDFARTFDASNWQASTPKRSWSDRGGLGRVATEAINRPQSPRGWSTVQCDVHARPPGGPRRTPRRSRTVRPSIGQCDRSIDVLSFDAGRLAIPRRGIRCLGGFGVDSAPTGWTCRLLSEPWPANVSTPTRRVCTHRMQSASYT